jgi:phospholipid/cholesterol/gamma-HCH transport system substrate-binding protein
MTVKTDTGRSVVRLIALGSVLALLVAGALWWFASASSTHVTAYFSKAVGLYAGSTVRVLGIEVGRIDQVQPQGDVVRTDMSIDPGVSIPAGAQAVVVAPSLVSDRYVQLTPPYTGGPKITSGAVIPLERTVTPMELDDLYRSANELSIALGPHGANKEGALSRLLDAGAANLQGNGQNLNDTIKNLGDAARTLEGSKGDLFATVDNLDKFTRALVQSDSQIHQFNSRFADVTGSLAQDSEQMGNALNSLAGAMTEVDGFIKDNRSKLTSNVDNLTDVSKALVDQRAAIAEILDVAPLAMSNFLNAYDAASGSVAVRLNLNEFTYPPIMMACLVIKHSTPKVLPQALADTCTKLAPVLDGTLKLPTANEVLGSLQQGKPPPLPLPLLDVLSQQRQAAPPQGGGPR